MPLQELLYLSRRDVETVDMPVIDIILALEAMFAEKGRGTTELPPKVGIHPSEEGFIHAMPAWIPGQRSAGVKWISAFPDNLKDGLPSASGLLILNDPGTGVPIAVMDATWITAKRTGAATALAAKYLAREDSTRVGIVACGVQGKSNLEALAALFSITTVKAFDAYPEVAEHYAKEMGETLDLDIETVKHPREAISGMDIVVTSGPIRKHPEPVIEAGWLSEGAFASPVDYDSYWQGEAMAQGDKFATDDRNQFETIRQAGYLQETPAPYADLGEIAVGSRPGRESDTERNFSMNLGIALDDMAIAIIIYRRAVELGIGTRLSL
ncbi:MAG: ornithine cyclodeaminase family protein [Lysobacterales bacterium]|jgi:ornithine cyclodeaminase/alanine dehydrogenase